MVIVWVGDKKRFLFIWFLQEKKVLWVWRKAQNYSEFLKINIIVGYLLLWEYYIALRFSLAINIDS